MKNGMKIVAIVIVAGSLTTLWAGKKDKKLITKEPMMSEAMMNAMKHGSPSENHKMLEPLIGNWTAEVKGWMEPNGKVEESKGLAKNWWVLGGRFVQEEFKGDWAGQPFEGMGLIGYDNIRGQYESIWLDNFMTGMMKFSGKYDATTKTFSSDGDFSCPMTGEKNKWARTETKIIDNDNHVYLSYSKGPDGKEFKNMEITYKRVK
ncbi:MAG: DUF1579 domain-containing protein [Elusimicrobiota bacterium]